MKQITQICNANKNKIFCDWVTVENKKTQPKVHFPGFYIKNSKTQQVMFNAKFLYAVS